MKSKTSVLLVIALLAFGRANADDQKPALHSCCAAAEPIPPVPFTGKSMYQLESSWTTDAAAQIKLGALRGKPQVLVMFFASCQYTCPFIISDMKRIEAGLPSELRTNVNFTLVSFDSERDTPEALRGVRAQRGLAGANWTLLRGEPEDVRELALLLGVNYRKDAGGQFTHSNLITILNAEGEIAYQQAGFNQPPGGALKQLTSLLRH
jgi:protein SCO1